MVVWAIALVGCQPLERPFQPEAKSSWRAAPGPRAALYVEPVEDGPAGLETAIATKLQNLGIAAFSGAAAANRYYVRGNIIDKDGGRYLNWAIFDPQDRDTGLYALEKLTTAENSAEMPPETIEALAVKSASDIDKLLGGDGINFAMINKPIIFVPIVEGAPGDGSESLAAAIQDELVRLGLDVLPTETGANFIVRGHAEITPPKLDTQIIELVWSLERRNGEQVGQIRQRNRIRAGSLNGAWGDVARLAARGGAGGVYDLLKKSEPDYFKSKS
ncbi:hypothetical protein [Sneathiella sp.]|uniref:hypothetical protein n=1 Tax=Sneathiella sp. TaxID=1964365 RepID=UPI00261BFFDC|nr:hypothetical protein [Sneathiella sp.]MDF2367795.1 hypothetical protein [Sneathiella sp.]